MSLILLISLFCCGLAIMLDYIPNEPKRHQMILYWISKYFYDKRKSIEQKRDEEIKSLQAYYKQAVKDNPDKITHYLNEEEKRTDMVNIYAESKLWYEFYLKPIFLCVYCMPSFWGTLIYLIAPGDASILNWSVTVVSAVFVNAILWNVYLKLSR